MKAYAEQSPITYAPKIRTPTLVMTNTQRLPRPADAVVQALSRAEGQRRADEVHRLSDLGHNADDPVRQRDVQRRWIGWIEEHFNEVTTSSR